MTPPAAPRRLPSEEVKASIRQRIAEGGWQPGMRLPSERELVQQFGCARMTVHHALRELEDEGLIERRQGSGSYVAQLHPISNVLQVRDIHDEIAERGHVHATRVCGVQREKASADIAAAMRLRKGAAGRSTCASCTWRTACRSSSKTGTSTRRWRRTSWRSTSPRSRPRTCCSSTRR